MPTLSLQPSTLGSQSTQVPRGPRLGPSQPGCSMRCTCMRCTGRTSCCNRLGLLVPPGCRSTGTTRPSGASGFAWSEFACPLDGSTTNTNPITFDTHAFLSAYNSWCSAYMRVFTALPLLRSDCTTLQCPRFDVYSRRVRITATPTAVLCRRQTKRPVM